MSVADGHERSKPQHLFVVLALLYRLAISTSLAYRASPNSLIPWSMVVTGRQDDDWRRGKCLGVRVLSRKGSYSRLERRCLGLYKRLSIINHQPPQRCERGNVIKTAVHRRLRMADKDIRYSQQAKHSRVSRTYECTLRTISRTQYANVSSVTIMRMIMNHRVCLLTTFTRIEEPSAVKLGCRQFARSYEPVTRPVISEDRARMSTDSYSTIHTVGTHK